MYKSAGIFCQHRNTNVWESVCLCVRVYVCVNLKSVTGLIFTIFKLHSHTCTCNAMQCILCTWTSNRRDSFDFLFILAKIHNFCSTRCCLLWDFIFILKNTHTFFLPHFVKFCYFVLKFLFFLALSLFVVAHRR